ncbi:uncharacterized protein LOC144117786 [Amblyomma americanum]
MPVWIAEVKAAFGSGDSMAGAKRGSGTASPHVHQALRTLVGHNFKSRANKWVHVLPPLIPSPTPLWRVLCVHKCALDSIQNAAVVCGARRWTSSSSCRHRLSLGVHVVAATTGRLKDFVEKSNIFGKLRFSMVGATRLPSDMGR